MGAPFLTFSKGGGEGGECVANEFDFILQMPDSDGALTDDEEMLTAPAPGGAAHKALGGTASSAPDVAVTSVPVQGTGQTKAASSQPVAVVSAISTKLARLFAHMPRGGRVSPPANTVGVIELTRVYNDYARQNGRMQRQLHLEKKPSPDTPVAAAASGQHQNPTQGPPRKKPRAACPVCQNWGCRLRALPVITSKSGAGSSSPETVASGESGGSLGTLLSAVPAGLTHVCQSCAGWLLRHAGLTSHAHKNCAPGSGVVNPKCAQQLRQWDAAGFEFATPELRADVAAAKLAGGK